MPYIPLTPKEQQEMMDVVGISSLDELYIDIPAECRIDGLNLPNGKSEMEVQNKLKKLAAQNRTDLTCFLGGGFYDHYIPSAIDPLMSRGEFLTAYTPYQPEVSQGTLQAIYEFQSMICRLTGMEVANASLYDGGTALYEGMMMALRVTKRNKVLMDSGVNPIYRQMIQTYTTNLDIELVEAPISHGQTDRQAFQNLLDDSVGAVLIQNPNFFGAIDDFTDICQMVHNHKALVVASTYPISLAILKDPCSMGCDIVTGEGQSLGIPLGFGGPYLGFMATTKKLARKMPGRICGESVDANGNKSYVLTLQAREQHIRRDKATSNVCTNVALMALRATIYLSLVGKQGLKEIAQTCFDRASYAKKRFAQIKNVSVKTSSPTFNEITIELPISANEVIPAMIEKGIAIGWPLGRYYKGLDNLLLMAFTEKRTKEEIDVAAAALEEILCR